MKQHDCMEQRFSKFFFTLLPYKPKFCQYLPNKDHKWYLQKFRTTYCEETLDDYEPKRLFIISVTAEAACNLLRLMPARCMVRLIMELVGNRRFIVIPTTANVATLQERRPTGIRPGTPFSQHLHLWPDSHVPLTPRVTSQKGGTLEAACWLWQGYWSNNVANSYFILNHSTAKYCAPVWCRRAHTRLIDPAINDALWTVTECVCPNQRTIFLSSQTSNLLSFISEEQHCF